CTATSRASGWAASSSCPRSCRGTGRTRATTSTPGSAGRTAGTMLLSPERLGADDGSIERFDAAERVIHWTNAALFGVMLFTGASLYLGALSRVVGRRELVKTVHVYCGLVL